MRIVNLLAKEGKVDLVFELEGVIKKYPGVEAIKDFSLSLERGKILGLLGPNGSGKTSFMKLFMGVIRPARGNIRVLENAGGQKKVLMFRKWMPLIRG